MATPFVVDIKKEAKILAMKARGDSDQKVADEIKVSRQAVQKHKVAMRENIAEHRKVLLETQADDYMDLRSLAVYRLREKLTDDEIAAEIPARDLAQVHKEAFNAHQILLNKPTEIPGVPGTAIKGRENIDRIAIAEEFNRNFIQLQRAAINAMSVDGDIEEGEFDECQTD